MSFKGKLSIIFAITTGLFFITTNAFAGFNQAFNGTFINVSDGQASWCDFDMDGDLDVFITGRAYGYGRSRFYRNNGTYFTQVFNNDVIGLEYSSADWGDYDNDGDPDLLVTGYRNGNRYTRIYRNNGNAGFSNQYNGQVIGVQNGEAKWGDYNNDGKLDIVVVGQSASGRTARIYKNTGSGFSQVFSNHLTGVSDADVDWGDYDNDGDLDILLSGSTGSGQVTRIYRNNGSSGFSHVFGNTLTGVYRGEVKWGDYDNDGDLDILLSGSTNWSSTTRIYRNNGSSFSAQVFLTSYSFSSADWGDMDNDGDLDLIVNGYTTSWAPQTKVYRNNGGSFSPIFNGQVPHFDSGSSDWGDYDNDGDLDLIICGLNNSGQGITRIYRNTSSSSNTNPSVPSGLSSSVLSTVTLSWNSSTDSQTNNNALTYNVRIGSTPGADNIVGKNARTNGKRLFPEKGNAQNGTNFKIKDLSAGTYYWSVQAIDNGYAASAFATEKSFVVIGKPTVTTKNITNIGTNTANSGGNVTSNGGSPVTARGIVWSTSPNPTLSSNQGSTTNGTGNGNFNSSLSGLTATTTYYVRAYATNSIGTGYGTQKTFTTTNQFSSAFNGSFAGVFNGNAKWCDYNSDGRLDVLVTGDDNNYGLSRLYRNNGNSFTQVFSNQLTHVYNSSADWGDIDNDGDPDLIITGNRYGSRIAWIYRNNGNSGFSHVYNGQITGIENGEAKWADFNNDGKLDLAIVGQSNSGRIAKLYKNTGSGFSEVFTNQITAVSESSLDWGDIDNDGDLDLVISGFSNFNGAITRVFRNNGNAGFSHVFGNTLYGVYRGQVKFGDLDNDGDLDLLVTGFANGYPRTRVYKNNGSGYSLFNSGIDGFSNSAADWGDYDNDGDLDLIIGGTSSSWNIRTRLYRNNGNSFTSVFNNQFDHVRYCSFDWGDYDNDKDLDLIITGQNNSNQRITKIYKNGGSIFNTAPSVPSGLSETIGTNDVTLNWSKSTDTQTSQNGITYNIRIGSTSGANDVLSAIARTNGKRLVPEMGNTHHRNNFKIKGLTAGTYYWSVQAIDQGYLASAFATEKSFVVATPPTLTTNNITNIQTSTATSGGNISTDGGSAITARGVVWHTSTNPTLTNKLGSTSNGNGTGNYSSAITGLNPNTTYYVRAYATNGIGTSYGQQRTFTTKKHFSKVFNNAFTGLYDGEVKWCDFDSDGDLDFIVTGDDGSNGRTRLYKNNGSSFSLVFNNQFINLYYSSADWGDMDNDGDPDLLVTGNYYGSYVTRIYRNNGTAGFSAVYNGQITGIQRGQAKWGDFNNDGLPDIVVAGSSSSGRIAKLYKNTGSGFTHVFPNQIIKVDNASLEWGDIDNDGDLDLAISGYSSSGPISRIYKNNGTAGFSHAFGNTFQGIYDGNTKLGDLDNDGDLDLLVTGYSNSGARTRVYKNNGNSFSSFNTGISHFSYSTADWGDMDNDGDLDLIIAGYTSSWNTRTRIYRNNGNTFSSVYTNQIEHINSGSIDWGDYDGDNDLDILVSGLSNSGGRVTYIYQNGNNTPNTAPSIPNGLNSSVNQKDVVLTWNKATDTQTSQNGLAYNVRVGTSSGASNIVSKTATGLGKKLIPDLGNTQHSTTFKLENLDPGIYYWAVQAIDKGFLNSAFSAEGTFEIIDGIIWDGNTWNNGTGPTSATGNKKVYVYPGNKASINYHSSALSLKVFTGGKLRIRKNRSVTLTDSLVNNGLIEIVDKGSLVQTNSSQLGGTGNFKVTRKGGVSNKSYQIWSSPVETENITTVFPATNLYDIYVFDGHLQKWKYDYASTTPSNSHANSPYSFTTNDLITGADGKFDVARGYYAVGKTSGNRVFSGKVNNGDIQFPIVATSLGNQPNWEGDDWNLVGNPYPSAISAASFWQENAISNARINNAIYFWSDDNSYGTGYNQYHDFATWNMAGGTSATGGGSTSIPDGYISSCQGFWVKAINTSNLTFKNNMRVANNNHVFYKTNNSDWRKVWLSLTIDNKNYNQVLVAFNQNGTDGFDPSYDAQKLQGNANLSFGSLLNGDQFAIQTLPELKENQERVVPLSIITKQKGVHVFNIDTLQNMEKFDVFFEDTEKGKSTNVKKSPYVIYIDTPGTFDNRFYLRFKKKPADTNSTSIEESIVNANIKWHLDQNDLWIKSDNFTDPISSVRLYDINGRELYSSTFKKFTINHKVQLAQFSQGIYITRVTLKSGTQKTFRVTGL